MTPYTKSQGSQPRVCMKTYANSFAGGSPTPDSSPGLQDFMIEKECQDLNSCGSSRSSDDGSASDDSADVAVAAAATSDDNQVTKVEQNSSDDDDEDRFRSSPGLSQSFSDLNTNERQHEYLPKMRQRGEYMNKPYQCSNQKQRDSKQAAAACAVAVASSSAASQCCESDAEQVHHNLKEFITKVVCVDKYSDSECCSDAAKLARVTAMMTESSQLHKFVGVFGHSVSCMDTDCTNTCRMFRRIRTHIANASHRCALMHVYSQLLRMHIDSCTEQNCGLNACKAMLQARREDSLSVLPRNFQQVEQLIARKLKEDCTEIECASMKVNTVTAVDQPKEEPATSVGAVRQSASAPELSTCKTAVLQEIKQEALDLTAPSNIQMQPCG